MSLNDPRWGNRGNNEERGGKRGDEQGPPDLDEIWREFNQRLSGLFGRNREGGGPSGPRGNLPKRPDMPPFKQLGNGLLLLAILILVVWLCSGFYIVNTKERGVVLRMGRYHEVTQPGLHWRMPWPIETHETVDMTSVRTVSVDSQGGDRSLMITDDLNIVSVPFAVQYLLDDKRDDTATEIGPRNYIFKNFMLSEETFVRQIAEAAMREVVGRNKMDFVLYEGKAQIAQDAQ
ncbi:MAG: protease modulator HflK, partial [Azoarcus sp.]|nr:protease modulator HflK [Azoarcus sp.]